MGDDAEDTRQQSRDRHDAENGEVREGEVVQRDDAPDVLLDVPTLHVDKIGLEVEDLRARVSLQAEVLDLLKLNVGADVALGRVKLDIEGVDAEALLKVRLHNVAAILSRVLATIDRHPQILEQLTSAAGSAVRDVGSGARDAVGELGRGAGGAVEDVGAGAGGAVEDVGAGAGGAVEDVGGEAGSAVGEAGRAARRAVDDVGSGAGDAAEGVGGNAGKAAEDVAEDADDGSDEDDASGSGRRKAARREAREPRPSPRAREKAEPARKRRRHPP